MSCSKCKFWSEMLAAVEDGQAKAMCLSSDGPRSGHFVSKFNSCDHFEQGMPVDLDHVPPGQRERSADYRKSMMDD